MSGVSGLWFAASSNVHSMRFGSSRSDLRETVSVDLPSSQMILRPSSPSSVNVGASSSSGLFHHSQRHNVDLPVERNGRDKRPAMQISSTCCCLLPMSSGFDSQRVRSQSVSKVSVKRTP
ncbi:MAG: hypothetical protein IPL32_20455 [Chloracidobacterium sp.]|nr:hypothetical protein [Chloracidobacterium sp.]